ncbi:MAG: glycosyltransferase family 2 protein [Planctomycetota bacterium]|nr:glycosyltransferase family 2 protein [Planctomycetota bacterium]
MSRIGLCVIARNEERFLSDCLKSVRGVADEIVVVDTGSTDRTRSIATMSGARVVDFAWVDDFSAARNAGLAALQSTHVLVLDADERLIDAENALQSAARDPRFTIGLLALHDANALDASFADVLAGRSRLWDPCFVPRFFVNDAALRFTRRVHETLTGDPLGVSAFLKSRRSSIAALSACIVHLGEVPQLRVERSKRERNTRLLERALDDDPSDGDLAGYLALELARSGALGEARKIGERHLWPFLETLRGIPDDAPKHSPVRLASVLATCLVQDGENERALDVISASHACCIEPHPNLVFLEGAANERLGRYGAARSAFEQCLALHANRYTIPVNPGATSSAPRLRLANLDLIAGDPDAALAHIDAQSSWSGQFELPAVLTRAEAHLQRGDPNRALQALAPVLSRPEAPPDLFAIAAAATEALGALDKSLRDTAKQFERSTWLETRRLALVSGL